MDSEIRDLDHIHEQDDDTALRKLSLVLMGAFAVVAVIFATGVMVVQGVDRDPEQEYDPLAQLMEAQELGAADAEELTEDDVEPEVETTELVFPEVLDRPEVSAALAAAAAEAKHPDPVIPGAPSHLPVSALPAEVAAGNDEPRGITVREPEPAEVEPVAVAASPEVATVDVQDGYSLQAISYTEAQQAQRFAEVLQGRGHSAYVISGTVGGRTYWRVRIGPFNSKQEAQSYKGRFEQEEQLKTLIVANAAQ